MKVKKLTAQEFARAVRLGLGRALVHVKKYGDRDVEAIILNALVTNSVYSVEVEGLRTAFLTQLVLCTGRVKYYAKALLARFDRKEKYENCDFQQQVAICIFFFELGFEKFLPFIFSKFRDMVAGGFGTTCGSELTSCAGIAGLDFAARVFGEFNRNWSDFECNLILKSARETFGEELVDVRMGVLSLKDEHIRCFMDACKRYEKKGDIYFYFRQTNFTLMDIIEGAADPMTWRKYSIYRRFGFKARDNEILQIFECLLKTQDPRKQLAFLQIFSLREMPLFDAKLLKLVDSKDWDLRAAAVHSLSQFRSPDVRRKALRLLKSRRDELMLSGLKLIIFNYRPEDAGLFLTILKSMKDADSIHTFGFLLLRIAQHSGGPELFKCFIWLYEHGPDSYCRTAFLEQLIVWKKCPADILHESKWDSRDETKFLARESSHAKQLTAIASRLQTVPSSS